MSNLIIHSYLLNGPGKGAKLEGAAIARALKDEVLAWAHIDALDPEAGAWIDANLFYLDRPAIEALLAEETRPRASMIGEGMLVILRGLNPKEGAEPEDMVSVRLWIDPHRIVSMRRRSMGPLNEVARMIAEGKGPETAGQFLALLVDRITDRIEPAVSKIAEEVDRLEDAVLDMADADLRRPITEIRRRSIHLHRHVAPQRDAIAEMLLAGPDWLDPLSRRSLVESHDRLLRIVEELDAIRDRAQVVKDELASALAERLNRNMYVLSVIAAVFLPLGFLTGLMGINLAGIPGADNPWAFHIFSGLLVVIVVLQVLIFRRLRWF